MEESGDFWRLWIKVEGRWIPVLEASNQVWTNAVVEGVILFTVQKKISFFFLIACYWMSDYGISLQIIKKKSKTGKGHEFLSK